MKSRSIEPLDIEFNESPTKIQMDSDEQINNDDKTKKKNLKFVPKIDMKGITDVFNNYATKKTLTAGFFNIALVKN